MISEQDVKSKLAEFCKQPLSNLKDETPIAGLVADSFMLVELLLELQETFGVTLSHEHLVGVETLGELISVLTDLETV